MKPIFRTLKNQLKKIWINLTNQKIEIVIKRPFYIGWLLNGSYYKTFTKVFLLFTFIWIIGFVITKSESINSIQKGSVILTYNQLEEQIIDSIHVADCKINFTLRNIDNSKLNYDFKLTKSGNDSNQICLKNDLDLRKINVDEYVTSDTNVVFARHLIFKYRQTGNQSSVELNIYGYGYLDDIPNYLMIGGLIIAIFLFRILSDKFTFAFTGNEKVISLHDLQLKKSNGLLRILKFDGTESEYRERIKRILSKLSLENKNYHWGNIIFMLVILRIAIVLSLRNITFENTIDGNWNFSPDTAYMSFLFNQLKDIFIFGIIIPPILFKLLLIFWYSFRLSFEFDKNQIYKINPLSFDNAGGLSPLGEVTLYLFYMFIAFFPHVYGTAYILNFPPHLQVLLPLYLLFTFLLFFVPLSSPHNSMKRAKNQILEKISDHYNELHEKYLIIINEYKNQDKNEELSDIFKRMKKVRNLYLERKKMPVWPYDFEIFVKFGTVFITNLLLYLSQYIFYIFK